MKTPIYSFLSEYAKAGISRLHMPGHKGRGPLGIEALDLTEVCGADSLYSANGIILESEKNASALFKSAHSFYSTEGSTLAIKAMLALVTSGTPSGKRATVLAARNAHKAYILSSALLDFDTKWIYGSSSHPCECIVTPSDVDRELSLMDELPSAVYITSPDYLGRMADIEGISRVTKKYSVPLLVDNAHGAYLAFLKKSLHPLAQGADMCCDSAHKTLPVLTGGAYLHISDSSAEKFLPSARSRMAVFGSTSPSYLILASLDLCNSYIENGYSRKLCDAVEKISALRANLSDMGFSPEETEPLKLVFCSSKFGYSGDELADILRGHSIEPEFSDRDYLVLMLTPEICDDAIERLMRVFSSLEKRAPLSTEIPRVRDGHKVSLSVREAVFSDIERIPVSKAAGRIAAAPTVSCPPAVPIVVSGEVIEEEDISLFIYYGINEVDVVK